MTRSLDPRRLETFRVVATAGKVSTAARLLHLSQPAVTAQVHQLEEEAGEPLLLRGPRGVRPTAAGLRLLDYARRVHALLEEAEAGLGGDATAAGPLLLAASTTLASYVLPGLLADFLRTVAPGTGVHLEVGNTEEVLPASETLHA